MSFSRVMYLYCDGRVCKEFEEPYTVDPGWSTITQQRRSAKQQGWVLVDGKDLCPECQEDADE